jgi:hypothetical protein
VQLHENPSNGRRNTAEEVYFSPSKCLYHKPLIIKLACTVENGGSVLGVEFHENSSNGRRDAAEMVLCSSDEVPFVTDRSRPNLQVLYVM